MMFFMILVFARPQEWLFPVLFGIPMLEIVFVFALAGLFVEANENILEFPPKCPQTWLLLGVVFASMMSHIAHTYMAALLNSTPMILKTCLYSILLISVLNSIDRFKAMSRLIVASTCLMAWHTYLQVTRGYGLGGRESWPEIVWSASKGWYTRTLFFGIFEDPNDLAQILVTAVPFVFGLTRKPTFFSRLLGAGLAWALIWSMLTTHSRGGLIGLIVTVCVMVVLRFPIRWTPTLFVLMIVSALILSPVMASGRMDESAHDRVIFWGQANEAFKHNLLFGVGTNLISDFIEEGRAVHSAYVLCYSETGLFGYWFWYGLIHLGMVGAWRVRKAFNRPASEDEAWMKRFSGQCIASMAGYCASSYFLGRAFVYPIFFLFAMLAALPILARQMLPEDHPPLLDVRKDLFVFSTIGALVSVVYIYISIVVLNHISYAP
jgi:hypothetical protein